VDGHALMVDTASVAKMAPAAHRVIIIIIIIIKNEKIRVTLCENAAGALYIVNKLQPKSKCMFVKQVKFDFGGLC